MKQIEDITLIKLLGKGTFGEVYLSQKKEEKNILLQKKWGKEKWINLKQKNILKVK